MRIKEKVQRPVKTPRRVDWRESHAGSLEEEEGGGLVVDDDRV